MEPLLIAFLGYILGCLARTLYDPLWKIMQDPTLKWDQKYTLTLLISIILSVITAAVTFPTDLTPTGTPMQIFLTTWTMGFTINHVLNKVVTYLGAEKPPSGG